MGHLRDLSKSNKQVHGKEKKMLSVSMSSFQRLIKKLFPPVITAIPGTHLNRLLNLPLPGFHQGLGHFFIKLTGLGVL